MGKRRGFRNQILLFLCCFLVLFSLIPPFNSSAEGEDHKVVRVGWHEEPYFIEDENGRRSGYSYEYQQKVAAYTGWDYEYVEGSWSELLQMLKDGEIDMLANLSYSAERAESILYSSLPMGTEAYYIFSAPGDISIKPDDYSTLNGKKVGVAKGSFQKNLFMEWAEEHDVQVELVEMSSTEEESLKLLGSDLDLFVTMDVNADPQSAVPIWKIGSSDFYFALSKDRADLLPELNNAMSKIQDENTYYNQQLNDKYLKNTETKMYLNPDELEWLQKHQTIRIGYQDNYLAFCAKDDKTGELIGALKDFLDYAETVLENAELKFEPVAYPTAADAIEALKRGEVDCVFPCNLAIDEAENMDLVITPVLMKTEMDALIRSADQKSFLFNKDVTVAVNEGNTNYELFLKNYFPGWKIKYFKNTDAGLVGVSQGEADCVIVSNYRYNNLAKQCDRLKLVSVYSGVDLEYYIAVRKGEPELYSILARIIAIVPGSIVNAALTYYSSVDAKTSFMEFIRENIVLVMAVITGVLLVIIFLLVIYIRAQKKASKEQHMVENLNKQVYVDALTHVRNKGGFDKYIDSLKKKISNGEIKDVAVGMLDCNNLKTINDRYGHEKGDVYLKAATKLICSIFQHSPVFRIGGDEFVVVLTGEDFDNRQDLIRKFEFTRRDICAAAENAWDQVHIAMGIAVYDASEDSTIDDTVKRADEMMYENKRYLKKVQYRF